jgi:hypothetical protein
MQVRLTRKLADYIDGVDLRSHEVGDTFDVPVSDAILLIAEGWAEAHKAEVGFGDSYRDRAADASVRTDRRGRRTDPPARVLRLLDRISQARRNLDRRYLVRGERRRVEDRIREELHDARARTVVASKRGGRSRDPLA